MIAYLDSSVALRHILAGEDALRHAFALDSVVSSELIEIECLRVIQRCRLDGDLDDDGFVTAVGRLEKVLNGIAFVALSPAVKKRAMERENARRAPSRLRPRFRRGQARGSAGRFFPRCQHEQVRESTRLRRAAVPGLIGRPRPAGVRPKSPLPSVKQVLELPLRHLGQPFLPGGYA
jgi:hypothetical protein